MTYTLTEIGDSTGYDSDSDSDGGSKRRRFDGQIEVVGRVRVIRREGNGPVFALLEALRSYLGIVLIVREYSEHAIREGTGAKAASYVELVAAGTDLKDKLSDGTWGIAIDRDTVASSLNAVLGAVNRFIGDRPLHIQPISIGINSPSSQADIASILLDNLGYKLKLTTSHVVCNLIFTTSFALLQSSGWAQINSEQITELFEKTYPQADATTRFKLKAHKLTQIDETNRQFDWILILDGVQKKVSRVGNGPLSALLAAIQPHLNTPTPLSVRGFSEHSIGEGSEVWAASHVELTTEIGGKKASSWGFGTDASITSSAWKAVLNAASGFSLAANGTRANLWCNELIFSSSCTNGDAQLIEYRIM